MTEKQSRKEKDAQNKDRIKGSTEHENKEHGAKAEQLLQLRKRKEV